MEEVIHPVEEVIHTLVILVSALGPNFRLGLGLGPGLDKNNWIFPQQEKAHRGDTIERPKSRASVRMIINI